MKDRESHYRSWASSEGGFMRSVRSGAEKSSFPTHVADDCGEDLVEVRSTGTS